VFAISHHWPFVHWHKIPVSIRVVGGIAMTINILAGATFNGFAKVLGGALSPLSLVLVSELLTSFFVLFSFGALPTLRRLSHLTKHQLRWALVMGTFSGIAAPMLWFWGLHFTTAINASFFGKADVVFLMFFAHILLGEKIRRIHVLAAGTVLLGVAMISLRGGQAGFSLQAGDIIILCATFCYAVGNITFRKFLHGIEPHIALLCRSLTGIAGFFLLSPLVSHTLMTDIQRFPMALVPALIGFSFVSRFLNSVSFYEAIDDLPVSTVSVLGPLDVIVAAGFATWYLGESLAWYHISGGSLILLGSLLLEFVNTFHPETALVHQERTPHIITHKP
jgi:drug/metabolite transporter (DMT)-like permease